MPRNVVSATVLMAALATAPREADDPAFVGPPKPPTASEKDPVAEAFVRLEAAASKKDWRAESDASSALGALGQKAIRKVIDGAEDNPDLRVRQACVRLLCTTFGKDEFAQETLLRAGLHDKDDRIRYESAFHLGDLKVYRAHRPLRRLFDTLAAEKPPSLLRMTVAKSLAELGEGDVVRALYEGVTDDGYMMRYMANRGLKALTGRTLDDFEGYNAGEGAFVSGGVEAMFPFDAVTASERKAKRYAAAAAYCRWLKESRPDLYKHLTGSF